MEKDVKELNGELREKIKDGVRRGVIKKVQVEIVEVGERTVKAKLQGQRKAREFIAYRVSNTGDLIIQSSDVIIMPLGHYSSEWTLCVYNSGKGRALVPFLTPAAGARLVLVSREFVGIMKAQRFRDGDILGHAEGAPVVYRES